MLPKSGVIGICYTIIATEIIFLSIFTFTINLSYERIKDINCN